MSLAGAPARLRLCWVCRSLPLPSSAARPRPARPSCPQSWASPLLGGGIAGYVLYDTTHWALHSGRAEWLCGHVLKTSHMDHHYVVGCYKGACACPMQRLFAGCTCAGAWPPAHGWGVLPNLPDVRRVGSRPASYALPAHGGDPPGQSARPKRLCRRVVRLLQDDTVGYGISSTLYDHVFNTMSKHLLKKMA